METELEAEQRMKSTEIRRLSKSEKKLIGQEGFKRFGIDKSRVVLRRKGLTEVWPARSKVAKVVTCAGFWDAEHGLHL